MADTYDIRPAEDPKAWDAFVHSAPAGTVFSTAAWLDAAAQALQQPIHRFGLYKNNHLIAAVSGVEQRRAGFSKFTTPLLTPHGGLLLAPIDGKGPAKEESAWTHAVRQFVPYLQSRYDYIQLTHGPVVADVREYLWADWQAVPRYTYLFDTADPDALWDRLERRTRTVIRKAQKAGFKLSRTDDFALLRRQYEGIFGAAGTPPVPSDLVQRFAEQAHAAGLAELVQVNAPDDQPAAMVAFVHGPDTAYAWLPGADPAYNHTGALSLLYWEYLKECPRPRFDFVGANLPPIAKFKRGFGGTLAPYYAVEGYRNAFVKTALAGKAALHNLLGS